MSQKQLPDPKQQIYNCLNWMSNPIVRKEYNDDQLLLDAHEMLHAFVAPTHHAKFVEVLDKLRMRNKRLNATVEAWERASAELVTACTQIAELQAVIKKESNIENTF